MKAAIGIIWAICFLNGQRATSQVTVSWNTNMPEQFTMNDLWNITLTKTGRNALSCKLELKIETSAHVPVLTIETRPFILTPGINPLSVIRSTLLVDTRMGNNSFAETLRQTGMLPMGSYIFCATVFAATDYSVLGLSCEERNLGCQLPPYLVSPYNGEMLTTHYPTLRWHPPTPVDESKISYGIVLVAIKENQSVAEAIHNNARLLDKKVHALEFLQYTDEFVLLEAGKKYAWKVDVFYEGVFSTRTEEWTFSIASPGKPVADKTLGCYSLINHSPADGFYVGDGVLRIGYDNRCNDERLRYRIIEVESRKKIEMDQEVDLHHGLNLIDLNLSKSAFKEGMMYLLIIQDNNNNRFETTFLISKPELL